MPSWTEEADSLILRDFGGAVPHLEVSDIPKGKAIEAVNVVFPPGRVETRPGFGPALPADGEQRELFSWSQGLVGGATDWIAYLSGTSSIKVRNLTGTPVTTTIASSLPTTSRVSFASWGQRLYFALLSDAMRGVTHGKVWGGNIASQAGNCFQRPLKVTTEVTLGVTEPSGGVVTQGSHLFGVLFQTPEGFWTKPSPAATSTLVPVYSALNAAGGKNALLTLTPASTWPAWITKAQVVMSAVTSVTAPQMYLVGGSLTDVSAFRGIGTPIILLVDVDDATLTSRADKADNYLGLLTQDANDNPPFNPFGVVVWGNRLVWFANYGGVDSIIISEQGQPEWVTADQHVLQLPGGVAISGWFVLRGSLYVLSSAGKTYAFSDNGGKPVSFGPPVEIDSNIGTVSSGAVTVTGGTSGYALVAAPQGLYYFGGSNYSEVPLSFYQTPRWSEIDWSAVHEMKLLNFHRDKLILFRCKMLNGTFRMLTWSYLKGTKAEKVDFSEWLQWSNRGMPAIVPKSPYSFGSEIWIGAGSVSGDLAVRLQVPGIDTIDHLYHDFAVGSPAWVQPPWWYQVGPLPPGSDGSIAHCLGCSLRLDGVGKVYVRPVTMMTGAWGSPPGSIGSQLVTLVSGQAFYDVSLFDPSSSPSEIHSEAIFWLIGNTGPDVNDGGWMKMSTLIHYYSKVQAGW